MRLKILSTMMLGCLLCLLALSTDSYAQASVALCHREGPPPPAEPTGWHIIVVDDDSANETAHLGHGDFMVTEGTPCPPGGDTGGGGDPDPGAVPEPITILLFGTGLAGVGYATRRLRRKGTTDNDRP